MHTGIGLIVESSSGWDPMKEELLERQRKPLLIVLSGPSGVGKDSVLNRMKERGLDLNFIVTVATRERRSDEVEGKDYFFISEEEFERMIERDELIEHARVYDHYKGIPKAQVQEALKSGKDTIMRVDVQGAQTVRELYPEALLIFLSTETEEELIERLRARGSETPESLNLRVETLRRELDTVDTFDYYVLNPDGRLDSAVDAILGILQAEHLRTRPREVVL
jgi:guanylate kinase